MNRIILFDDMEHEMNFLERRAKMPAMRRVYLDIPTEVHDKWKAFAGKQGKSMKGFLESVIKETFEKEKIHGKK